MVRRELLHYQNPAAPMQDSIENCVFHLGLPVECCRFTTWRQDQFFSHVKPVDRLILGGTGKLFMVNLHAAAKSPTLRSSLKIE